MAVSGELVLDSKNFFKTFVMIPKIFLFAIGCFVGSINAIAQSISPGTSDELCPTIEYTFTVTLTGTGYSGIGVVGIAKNVAPLITAPPYNISTATGNTTFNFRAKFLDYNNAQTFKIDYTLSTIYSAYFAYTNIKSFQSPQAESQPLPTPTAITAPRCQSQSFNISFSNVKYVNPWVTPKLVYGTVTAYEYLLPTGWVMNGTTSTGSNWIAGSNNVTITSDLSNGHGSSIRIRAVNSCSADLIKGPEAFVSISRPAPTLTIAPVTQDAICSGNASFTISGMPSGSSVQWSVSNTTQASIASGGTSSTVTVSRIGTANTVITLTATVTHCVFTYTATQRISLGKPAPSPINVLLVDRELGRIQVESEPPIPGATDYRWYKDGVLQSTYHWTFAQIPISRTACNVGYGITVTQTNSCGTSPSTYKSVYVPCNNTYSVSPNPASENITVSPDDTENLSLMATTFDELRLYDFQGTLKKYQKFNKATTATMNTKGLKSGTYIIEIINGNYKERHQILIKK